MTLPPDRIGDKGQRFEISYVDEDGRRIIFGWAATQDGADSFLHSIALNPSMRDGEVRDRQEETP
jgi:hypothetical protein